MRLMDTETDSPWVDLTYETEYATAYSDGKPEVPHLKPPTHPELVHFVTARWAPP